MLDILITLGSSLFTGFLGWFFARRQNNAKAKSAEIDNEVKAAVFYKTLLDDAGKRLDEAIQTIHEKDQQIKVLILKMETLTGELRKYKQLSGKTK